MRLETKRRRVLILLSAFLIWPLVHRQLVDRYLVSPWRLAGWAMYCVPVYEPEIKTYGATAAGYGELSFPTDNAHDSLQLRQFLEHRAQLGRFVEPDLLSSRLLARYPDLDSVLIVVAQPVYRPESARARIVIDRYAYERSSLKIER